jgi:hypothetical protein
MAIEKNWQDGYAQAKTALKAKATDQPTGAPDSV